MVRAVIERSYEDWHRQARALLADDVPPREILWSETGAEQPMLGDLAVAQPHSAAARSSRFSVPRRFVELAREAAQHASPDRWNLFYRVLYRLVHGERALLNDALDADARALEALVKAVRHDAERMKAFVRFRAIGPQGAEHFVAWHRPDHDVAPLVAGHFARRYPNMQWSIFTPQSSVHWDGRALRRDAGVPASAIPKEDSDRAAEALWRTYYAAAFNPARANPGKLSRDMPARFRATLPEAPLIPGMLADAAVRTDELRRRSGGVTARRLVPATSDLEALRQAASACKGCELYRHATQTVFGEGPASASVVLLGEQPGDSEDVQGHPFVGPAGALLDRALETAGIPRADVYVTNAVKHFAWEPRGKRRIHRTPRLSEMRACRPWMEAELAAITPEWIVCLGGTAARSLLGPQARVNALRGRVLTGHSWAPNIVVTLHPAAVLRADGEEAQRAAFEGMVGDLRLVKVD
jgi:probable DNA metabolism protein